MTEEQYQELKKEMCAGFSFCSDACPLYRYESERGIHACGALCDILEHTDFDEAARIVSEWKEKKQETG